ncbi:MAG: hypothetical protein PHU25_01070 [Deltaproteobacteria bacterium]|nr:hypothetical protein [Deltaproteobacteria bacterium]
MGASLSDFFFVPAAVLLLFTAWREKRWLATQPVLWAIAAIASSGILASLVSGHPMDDIRYIARNGLFVVVTAGIAALSRDGQANARIRGGFVGAGAVATVVSLVGYGLVLAFFRDEGGLRPFVFSSANPVFDGWPRLAETYAHSPQHFGEYLVALLAVATCCWEGIPTGRWRALRGLIIVLLSIALVLTFSFAIVGGIVPCGVAGEACRCDLLDREHDVYAAKGEVCYPQRSAWPSGSIETVYHQSKRYELGAFAENSVAGLGQTGYQTYAEERFQRETGTSNGNFYGTTHSTFPGVLAEAGSLGGLALVFLVAAISAMRRERVTNNEGLWFGIVALLVVGINVDILSNRNLWVLVGLLLGGGGNRYG